MKEAPGMYQSADEPLLPVENPGRWSAHKRRHVVQATSFGVKRRKSLLATSGRCSKGSSAKGFREYEGVI